MTKTKKKPALNNSVKHESSSAKARVGASLWSKRSRRLYQDKSLADAAYKGRTIEPGRTDYDVSNIERVTVTDVHYNGSSTDSQGFFSMMTSTDEQRISLWSLHPNAPGDSPPVPEFVAGVNSDPAIAMEQVVADVVENVLKTTTGETRQVLNSIIESSPTTLNEIKYRIARLATPETSKQVKIDLEDVVNTIMDKVDAATKNAVGGEITVTPKEEFERLVGECSVVHNQISVATCSGNSTSDECMFWDVLGMSIGGTGGNDALATYEVIDVVYCEQQYTQVSASNGDIILILAPDDTVETIANLVLVVVKPSSSLYAECSRIKGNGIAIQDARVSFKLLDDKNIVVASSGNVVCPSNNFATNDNASHLNSTLSGPRHTVVTIPSGTGLSSVVHERFADPGTSENPMGIWPEEVDDLYIESGGNSTYGFVFNRSSNLLVNGAAASGGFTNTLFTKKSRDVFMFKGSNSSYHFGTAFINGTGDECTLSLDLPQGESVTWLQKYVDNNESWNVLLTSVKTIEFTTRYQYEGHIIRMPGQGNIFEYSYDVSLKVNGKTLDYNCLTDLGTGDTVPTGLRDTCDYLRFKLVRVSSSSAQAPEDSSSSGTVIPDGGFTTFGLYEDDTQLTSNLFDVFIYRSGDTIIATSAVGSPQTLQLQTNYEFIPLTSNSRVCNTKVLVVPEQPTAFPSGVKILASPTRNLGSWTGHQKIEISHTQRMHTKELLFLDNWTSAITSNGMAIARSNVLVAGAGSAMWKVLNAYGYANSPDSGFSLWMIQGSELPTTYGTSPYANANDSILFYSGGAVRGEDAILFPVYGTSYSSSLRLTYSGIADDGDVAEVKKVVQDHNVPYMSIPNDAITSSVGGSSEEAARLFSRTKSCVIKAFNYTVNGSKKPFLYDASQLNIPMNNDTFGFTKAVFNYNPRLSRASCTIKFSNWELEVTSGTLAFTLLFYGIDFAPYSDGDTIPIGDFGMTVLDFHGACASQLLGVPQRSEPATVATTVSPHPPSTVDGVVWKTTIGVQNYSGLKSAMYASHSSIVRMCPGNDATYQSIVSDYKRVENKINTYVQGFPAFKSKERNMHRLYTGGPKAFTANGVYEYADALIGMITGSAARQLVNGIPCPFLFHAWSEVCQHYTIDALWHDAVYSVNGDTWNSSYWFSIQAPYSNINPTWMKYNAGASAYGNAMNNRQTKKATQEGKSGDFTRSFFIQSYVANPEAMSVSVVPTFATYLSSKGGSVAVAGDVAQSVIVYHESSANLHYTNCVNPVTSSNLITGLFSGSVIAPTINYENTVYQNGVEGGDSLPAELFTPYLDVWTPSYPPTLRLVLQSCYQGNRGLTVTLLNLVQGALTDEGKSAFKKNTNKMFAKQAGLCAPFITSLRMSRIYTAAWNENAQSLSPNSTGLQCCMPDAITRLWKANAFNSYTNNDSDYIVTSLSSAGASARRIINTSRRVSQVYRRFRISEGYNFQWQGYNKKLHTGKYQFVMLASDVLAGSTTALPVGSDPGTQALVASTTTVSKIFAGIMGGMLGSMITCGIAYYTTDRMAANEAKLAYQKRMAELAEENAKNVSKENPFDTGKSSGEQSEEASESVENEMTADVSGDVSADVSADTGLDSIGASISEGVGDTATAAAEDVAIDAIAGAAGAD